jgi:hypothetical protein
VLKSVNDETPSSIRSVYVNKFTIVYTFLLFVVTPEAVMMQTAANPSQLKDLKNESTSRDATVF